MKTVIEAMAGYRTQRWRLLKNEMNELWGAGTQPLYTVWKANPTIFLYCIIIRHFSMLINLTSLSFKFNNQNRNQTLI
jgi:hypothetical protein